MVILRIKNLLIVSLLLLCSCAVSSLCLRTEYGYGAPFALGNAVNSAGNGKPLDMHFSRVALGREVAKLGSFTTECFVGPYTAVPQNQGSAGFGGSIMPRIIYDGFGTTRPFLMVDLGMGYADFKSQGSDFEFQVGSSIGILYPISEQWDASIAYQLTHFSNAGIARPNPGLNTDLLTIGAEFKF